MEAKHTPGPWLHMLWNHHLKCWMSPRISSDCAEVEQRIKDNPAYKIVCITMGQVVSAPELLEALEDMADLWERVHPEVIAGKPSLNKAKAAIAKAKGL